MIEQFYLAHRWDPNSLRGSGSNENEGVLHILQSSKAGASPSDPV